MKIKNIIVLLAILNPSISATSDCSNDCGCEPINICNTCPLQNSCNEVYGQNVYVGRSQGNNFVRRRMGIANKEHKFCMDKVYGVTSITFEYQKTFKDSGLAKWFSSNGTGSMTYGLDYEQDLPGTGTFDINALNFGVTTSGIISFCPSKSDFIADIYIFLGWDEFIKGSWTCVDIPITSTNWNLNLQDCANNVTDATTYPTNSVGTGNIDVVFKSPTPMKDAFKGKEGFGDAPQLKFGKICGKQKDSTVANIRFDLGYDFINNNKYLIAASFDMVAPIGTKPSAEFLFNAVAGNYYRWECGAFGLWQYEWWHNCDTNNRSMFSILANLNHVFARSNQRLLSLDIPGVENNQKTWSQYLLLKTFNNAMQATGIERAANILAGDIKVKANLEANILASLEYYTDTWMSGIGWEFWARSKEELTCRQFGIPNNFYAVMGSTEWDGATTASPANNNLVAPDSTISKNGDAQPIADNLFISNDNFLYGPALQPSAYSNKIFAYIGRSCHPCDDWEYFGLFGSEVEFGQANRTFSMWAVFAKLGIGF